MSWSVGLITPGKELMCCFDLERLSIPAYIPLGSRWTKPKGKRKPVRTYFFPFPGYIFLKDAKFFYEELSTVRGFRRVLFENINERNVALVKQKQAAGAFDVDDSKPSKKNFKAGEFIRINMGPLMGLNGIVDRDTNGQNWALINIGIARVKIFVDFIDRVDVIS